MDACLQLLGYLWQFDMDVICGLLPSNDQLQPSYNKAKFALTIHPQGLNISIKFKVGPTLACSYGHRKPNSTRPLIVFQDIIHTEINCL